MYETDNLAPSTPQQFAFVDSFQTAVLALVAAVPAGTSVWSPTCLVHCISGQSTYSQLMADGPGTSMQTAVETWFFGGIQQRVISPCQGWACVNACGVSEQGLPCNTGDKDCNPITISTQGGPKGFQQSAPQQQQQQPAQQQVNLQVPALYGEQQQQLAQFQQQEQSQQQKNGRRMRRLMSEARVEKLAAGAPTCCEGAEDQ